jgi:hypothetical protein
VTRAYTQRTNASTQRKGAKDAKVAKKCKGKVKVWEIQMAHNAATISRISNVERVYLAVISLSSFFAFFAPLR